MVVRARTAREMSPMMTRYILIALATMVAVALTGCTDPNNPDNDGNGQIDSDDVETCLLPVSVPLPGVTAEIYTVTQHSWGHEYDIFDTSSEVETEDEVEVPADVDVRVEMVAPGQDYCPEDLNVDPDNVPHEPIAFSGGAIVEEGIYATYVDEDCSSRSGDGEYEVTIDDYCDDGNIYLVAAGAGGGMIDGNVYENGVGGGGEILSATKFSMYYPTGDVRWFCPIPVD